MGYSALLSHADSKSHKELCSRPTQNFAISSFFSNPSTSDNNQNYSSSTGSQLHQPSNCSNDERSKPSSSTGTVTVPTKNLFYTTGDILKSEIMWILYTVSMHQSFKSNEHIGFVFQKMFPDSEMAKKFQCAERKSAYLCTFGIGEYLKNELIENINKCEFYTILFDESLNKKMQEKQMDIHVRYWANTQVVTRYLCSVFLGHAKTQDMIHHFEGGIQELNKAKLQQISMDGPNVNWSFF
jgi:hypothetical protein